MSEDTHLVRCHGRRLRNEPPTEPALPLLTKADIGILRPVMLDVVSICVQYDGGGTELFCIDDLHHRQNNGRYENYFSKRLQRSSRQKKRGAPLGGHTLRI